MTRYISDVIKRIIRFASALLAFLVAVIAVGYLFWIFAIICYYAFGGLIDNHAGDKTAKAYVEKIKSPLESFREASGHYPDTLQEVASLPPPPLGLTYKRELGRYPGNPDTYRIDYDSLDYWSGSGQWFDDE